jgi:hypothetical protein
MTETGGALKPLMPFCLVSLGNMAPLRKAKVVEFSRTLDDGTNIYKGHMDAEYTIGK